jgi:hypothetical protein
VTLQKQKQFFKGWLMRTESSLRIAIPCKKQKQQKFARLKHQNKFRRASKKNMPKQKQKQTYTSSFT